MRAFADIAPIGLDRKLFDIQQSSAITKMLTNYRPDLVINTAAFHNVELCETRPDLAIAVNALAVDDLAGQCASAGVALAHISTDYVFDGAARSPYVETDATSPIGAYGISKLAGELFVKRSLERAFVFRTSGLYGLRGSSTKGYTFIERILTSARERKPIRVVTDVSCSPSYTYHVALGIRRVVETGAFGTYHVTNAGSCSWFDFARETLRRAGYTTAIEPVTAATFPSLARRPAYSVLANAAMDRLDLEAMPSWQDGIAAYLAEKAA